MKEKQEFKSVLDPLSEKERAELKESISRHGIRHEITLYNNTDFVLDGYNRWEIAQELGIPETDIPTKEEWYENEDEAVEEIIRSHVGRRNMNPKAYKLHYGRLYLKSKKNRGNPQLGQNAPIGNEAQRSSSPIAEEHGIDESTVRRAGKLYESIEKLCDSGKKLYHDTNKLTDAHVLKLAKLPESGQVEIVTQIRKGLQTADEALKVKTPSEPEPLWKQFAAKHADALNHLTQAIAAINWIEKQGEAAAYLAPVITRIKTDYKQLRRTISQNCPVNEKSGKIVTKVQVRK